MSVKISVVVPTYRRPELLAKCLMALAAQKFNKDEFEVIVVSDGPDEITKKAVSKRIKKQSPAFRFYHTPEKKGPAAARNYGWLIARGTLIAFTDDDCLPDKNWLQSFYSNYNPASETAMTGKTIVPISEKPTDYELNISHLQTAEFITANCCCSKTILEKTGGFDEQFTMAWREDSDLEFKLIKENIQIIKVNDAVVTHPVRKAAWGVSIKEQKKTMFNALLYKKYPDLYRQKIQQKPPINYYIMIVAFLLMVIGILSKTTVIGIIGLLVWLTLTLIFIGQRLKATTWSLAHVAEMVVTSLIIPFLSIYWQFYGALKYRVLFI